MVTTVTIPKEKLKIVDRAEIRDEQEQLARSRIAMDRIAAFVADPTQDELINMGAGPGTGLRLSPEQIEEQIKAGAGVSGIFTVVEPADLELYRSYMYPPLSMPEKPEVIVTLVDLYTGNAVTRYQEGRLAVKAMCPDGRESWLVISVPVPTLLMCYMGVVWGWPKYVADVMTVTPTKAEVIYEGEVRWSMDFSPDPVDEATLKELKERRRFEFPNTIAFHVDKGGACLLRHTGRGYEDPEVVESSFHVAEWQAGMVKVYMRPQDPWAGLIPANSVTPGVYQRFMSAGGADSVWQKVKG